MNNPITSAINSIGRNITNVTNGQNPLFAPQIANLFGFNVQGIPLISARDYFLTQMESWFTSIPLTTQWIVLVHSYPQCVNTRIIQGFEKTGGSRNSFDIDRAVSILKSAPLQKIVGCLFVQGINIPGDGLEVENVNISNNRGFLGVPITRARKPLDNLTIEFLETNTSFTDFVVRPWMIATSHYGLVARNPRDPAEQAKNVKTTITVMQYTRTMQKISMIPRKIWHFYNCAPISVPNQQMTYDQESMERNILKTEWTYSHYTVENNLYFPLATIINRISRGELPGIFPELPSSVDVAGFF